ncbi:MAG: rRNA maturation RNase YbeY [Acetobacteraceae bacterium]
MDPPSSLAAPEAGSSPHPEIIITEPGWRRLVPGAARIAARATRVGSRMTVTVLLADDRTVRRLNARDRGLDKPTNVLTYDPPAPGLPGQIVLALGVVRREAAAAGRRPSHHLAHLILHGALHLAGHDHHHPGDARRMEMAEARLLHRIGVPNPWRRT